MFFSGGNPAYLSRVLQGSPVWQRIRDRVADGSLAYAGCSAGVACLSDPTYDSDTDDFERVWAPGLGYFPKILFAPHWDILETWIPGARAFITSAAPADGHRSSRSTSRRRSSATACSGRCTASAACTCTRAGSGWGSTAPATRWELAMPLAGAAPAAG